MAKKNAWFKHYNTASDGATLRTLWDNGDMEAYALFWKFHELLSRFEDEKERGKMTISWAVLSRETGWKPSKCRRVLARICSLSKIEMNEKPDGNVSFLSPNWLELQERRGGKRDPKKEQKPDRGERRDERGEITDTELAKSTPSVVSFNERLKPENQPFFEVLSNLGITNVKILNNIHLVREEFESKENFDAFIRKVSLSENFNKIDNAYARKEYLAGAILNKSGIVGEQNATA